MRLIIEDNDEQFRAYLLEKIENLANSKNLYVLEMYTFIQEQDFEVRFIKTDRTDYRGEAWPTEFTVHKTPYETYDSLCWLFFHELGHLVLMNSEFEAVFKCAKAAHYKKCGFEHEHGITGTVKAITNITISTMTLTLKKTLSVCLPHT